MRKIAYKIALLVCATNALFADYNGSLPSAITLQGGESQTHKAIMDCSSYWECVFGSETQSFTYSTRGSADSNLTLNATLPPNPQSKDKSKPFFIGTMTINPHSNLTMSDFESFNLGKALHINGGSLIFGNGDFATRYNTNITLTNGGKLGIVGKGFTNRGTITAQDSTISIIPTSAWNQGDITNNNGEITIGTDLLNIGQRGTLADTFSSVAHITNSGKLTIEGNLYNGGQENPKIMCQVGGCGGGSLTNHGGTITIKGQVISEPKGGQNSSISIYGGTLTATNGVQNKVGSTLTIGAYNGAMGQIQGSVDNQGDFIIDALGANAGNYTLITGNFSGNAPSLRNGNSDFTSSTMSADFKSLNIVKNDAKIDNFKMSLNHNQSATLGAFGDRVYAISGASGIKLKSTANAINHAIFSAFYTTPLAMMDALGADLSATNATKTPSKRTTKRTARRVAANQSRQNRMRQTRQTRQVIKTGKSATNSAYPNDVSAGFVLKGIAGNGAEGVLGGVKAGYGVDFANAHFALKLAYAYGSVEGATKGDIATHKTRTQSHNFALRSNIEARFAGNFGFDLGVSGAIALNDSTRAVESSAISVDSTLKSRQNFYQIAVDLALLYNFKVRNFTIAPYLGLNQGYIAMPDFAEKGAFSSGDAFALSAEAYSAYFLDAFAGAKMGFDFGDYGAILGDLEYKILAYKTQRARILRYANGDALRFVIPNAHKISVDLGYRKDFSQWYLLVDGNFGAMINAGKASDTSINLYTYGINAKFGYRF